MFNPQTFNGAQLTEIAHGVAALRAAEQFGYIEADAYGADDCAGLIARGADRELTEYLAQFGLTPETFTEAVRERTSERWQFFNSDALAGRILERDYPELMIR